MENQVQQGENDNRGPDDDDLQKLLKQQQELEEKIRNCSEARRLTASIVNSVTQDVMANIGGIENSIPDVVGGGGQSVNDSSQQESYIRYCEVNGMMDSMEDILLNAANLTRKEGWKKFKMLSDDDYGMGEFFRTSWPKN